MSKYENPYASALELIDQSLCGDCGYKTGLTGESMFEALCPDCTGITESILESEREVRDGHM